MAEKIIVASGKGGAGKTSLATGVALSLSQRGLRVLVMDFDIGQGYADFMISGEYTSLYNWGDALKGNCDTREAVNSNGTVDVVAAPKKWDDSFTPLKIKTFICTIEKDYDYILFDSPAGVTGGFKLAAHCADRAIIVSTPDEICTRAAATATDELIECGVDNIRLVINRFNKIPTTKGKYYNIDEVIDAVKAQLIGVVPEDKEISYASSTGFVNLKDCPAKAAYGRIADRICGTKVPLVIEKSKKEQTKSKAPLIVFLCILFALLIAVAGIFTTDCIRCTRLETPVFARFHEKTDGNTTRSDLFVYSVESEKQDGKIISSELKIRDKVIVAAIT